MKTSNPPRAARCDAIAPFHVMALVQQAAALAKQGMDVIHLGVGEPDFPTPAEIVAAGQQALAEGKTRYTPAFGIDELRKKVSAYYRDKLHVNVPWERIVLTPGGSGALQLALAALVGPGDGVLVTDPGYPCNRHFVELVSATPQLLQRHADDGWAVTAKTVAEAWQANTKGLLLASPDNPTGAMMARSEVEAIADLVAQKNGFLLMDEIYQGLSLSEPWSAASINENIIVINSFSKYFGMTGWRLGWMVVPEHMLEDVERMAQNFFLAPATMSQYAALVAFKPEVQEELERRRRELLARRELLLQALPELGWSVTGEPEGAFYLYVDVSPFTDDSFAFCAELLAATGVALTPGLDFGVAHNPNAYIRIAYTVTSDRLMEALTRIKEFLEKR